ncbi:hypothetical protein [Paucisalibacillus globulus]|uniref:hypothetical protein n=1 Tax=Paucisalibacillus globulus TaxID=351095 RepID=UPI00042310B9|nr:hypothetical protein [Paucisalibacillus globulus]
MPNSYTREDVENLLIQLKKYRRVIRSYQESDISLDYYHLKSEVKKLNNQLAEVKQKLSVVEEKYKDCIFDNHKLIEERNNLRHDLKKFKKEIHQNKNYTSKWNQEQQSISIRNADFQKLIEMVKDLQLNQNNMMSSHVDLERASLQNINTGQDLYKRFKELSEELMCSFNSIESRLLSISSRKGFMENMELEKDKNVDQIEDYSSIQEEKQIVNKQFKQEFIKGAEPENEGNKKASIISKEVSKKEIENNTLQTEQLEAGQVNSTLSNLQSQIVEIKKLLEENKTKGSTFPKQTFPNTSFQAVSSSRKKIEQGKELTFRDLQTAVNVSQVIGGGTKSKANLNENNYLAQAKQGAKPVFVSNREAKLKQTIPVSNPKSVRETAESSTNIIEQPEENKETIDLGSKENMTSTNDTIMETQQEKLTEREQIKEEPRYDTAMEEKSKFKLFWERLIKS